jgi:hypothetical protein
LSPLQAVAVTRCVLIFIATDDMSSIDLEQLISHVAKTCNGPGCVWSMENTPGVCVSGMRARL